jgi:ABC-2 type transport system permease protein
MMKVLDVAFKDLYRSFRNPFALVMMFAAPLLITGLLYFAFGGLVGGDRGFDLSRTRVHVVNLDRPGSAAGFAAGEMLVDFLQDEGLNEMLALTVVEDEASARTAVDRQDADVAVIIPPDFTKAVMGSGEETAVSLYQDPTLAIGPSIVKDLVNHFLDGFSGTKIATSVVNGQMADRGVMDDPATLQQAAGQYAAWLQSGGHGETESALVLRAPDGNEATAEGRTAVLEPTMAAMMIFFVFFMGAYGAESIIREDEEGTLARLFTTPTPQSVILGGKFVAVIFGLVIQIAVLLTTSALLFKVNWGQPASVFLAALGLIVASAGFGVLLMSFIKHTRQTGPIMGGVLPVMGMLGGLFTTGIPNLPAVFDTVTLAMPHGWALRAWKLAMAGAGPGSLLTPTLVLVAMGIVFFAAGVFVFRRRFN